MKRWKAWVGVAISAAAIWWAVRGVEWGLVGPALRNARWELLALVFLLAPVVNIGVRAVRWRITLWPVRRLPVSSCASATAIGLFANNVLPARIGEFVRAYALARRERVPTATAFGGLFLERMFDGFALVGEFFCPWGDCTSSVDATFAPAEGEDAYSGMVDDSPVRLWWDEGNARDFGGAGYGNLTGREM